MSEGFHCDLWSVLQLSMPDVWLLRNLLRELPDSGGLRQLRLLLLWYRSSILAAWEDREWNQNRIPQLNMDDH